MDVEINLLNNQGNLIDACYLATLLSLMSFKLPLIKVHAGEKLEICNKGSKRIFQSLSVHHIPIVVTFVFKSGTNLYAVDPLLEEEEIMDGRVSIAMNIYGDICAIHKPGGMGLKPDIFEDLFNLCQVKTVKMTKIIRELVKFRGKKDFRTL